MCVFVFDPSHLPVYLVAAFAKRLARLALTAPPTGLLIVLPLIYNLIRRHPSCRILIHKPSTENGGSQSLSLKWPTCFCNSPADVYTVIFLYHPRNN